MASTSSMRRGTLYAAIRARQNASISAPSAPAFVVCQPGAGADGAEIEAFCRARMAAYKVPRRIELVDAIPKSPTGKILKRVLRDEG
ncbi:MAG TPA: hypothetical protein VE871_19285, partial [Longimicrobium sp.]|nr:hypothetical protein [Longimicrobium sp.]